MGAERVESTLCDGELAVGEAARQGETAWAPHTAVVAGSAPGYEVVVPTYQRWRPTRDIGKRRGHQDRGSPFILEHTLAFLGVQGVPRERVTLFVADGFEEQQYRIALRHSDWADVRIVVSAPGIRNSRNFICQYFAEGTHVVSIDDDVERMMWKFRAGTTDENLRPLPRFGFQALIADAHRRMKQHGAFLWGVSTSRNPGFMSHKIVSVRNGLVNGYLHGFLARPHATDLLRQIGDAVDDAEFSVRNFAKDGVVLRYRMYTCRTLPYLNAGGLQTEFPHPESRKKAEREGAAALRSLFPHLIGLGQQRQQLRTTEVRFLQPSTKSRTGLLKQVRKRKLWMCGAGIDGPRRTLLDLLKGKKAKKPKRSKIVNPVMTLYSSLDDEDQILYRPNPKRPGSLAHHRYEAYRQAKTVAEAKHLGAQKLDFVHDWTHGFLVVTHLWTRPSPKADCKIGKGRLPPHCMDPVQPMHSPDAKSVQVSVRDGPAGGVAVCCQSWDRLVSRCPAWRDREKAQWATATGPLAQSPLAVLRMLLHWAETGQLAFQRKDGQALMAALQNAGAARAKKAVEQLLEELSAARASEQAAQAASQRCTGLLKFMTTTEPPGSSKRSAAGALEASGQPSKCLQRDLRSLFGIRAAAAGPAAPPAPAAPAPAVAPVAPAATPVTALLAAAAAAVATPEKLARPGKPSKKPRFRAGLLKPDGMEASE